MEELTLNMIDYEWVNKCDDTRQLRKALNLLREDGGYFRELENHINEKLKIVDKKYRSPNVEISLDDIKKHKEEVFQWEREIKNSDKVLTSNTKEIFDEVKGKPIEVTQIEKKKLAENEKLKGNELMKTREYDQAIKLYTQSIKYDPNEPTTYCNRALAYSKLQQFDNAINDCTKAISIKDDYTKAFYRRAVCYMENNKYKEAFTDLLIVLKDTPDSQEVISEINNLKSKWKNSIGKDEFQKIERVIDEEIEMAKKRHKKQEKQDTGFKKIKIVEETQVENKEAIEKFKQLLSSGPEVKKQIDDLVDASNYGEAEDLAREKLKETQNLLKEFNKNTEQHLKLENVISDINTMIEIIQNKARAVEKPVEKGKYYKTKILSEEVRENATKIAETEINFNDFPYSAIGFEKAYVTMKNKTASFFNFMKHFGSKNLENAYNRNELSYQLLSGLINVFKDNSLENQESASLAVEFLIAISKTKNFSLIKKFLKKTDKEDLKILFGSFKNKYPELVFSLDFEKLYL